MLTPFVKILNPRVPFAPHWTFEHVPMDWLTAIFGISEIKKERV